MGNQIMHPITLTYRLSNYFINIIGPFFTLDWEYVDHVIRFRYVTSPIPRPVTQRTDAIFEQDRASELLCAEENYVNTTSVL